MEDQAKQAQAFANEQLRKVQDIVKTVRHHHGPDIGARMTLITNMVNHINQTTMLEAGLVTMMLENDDADPVRVKNAVQAFIDLSTRGQMLPVATFTVMFTDDEKKLLMPFMHSIDEILGAIVKRFLGSMLAV